MCCEVAVSDLCCCGVWQDTMCRAVGIPASHPPTHAPHPLLSPTPCRYPEGLLVAVHHMSKLGVPIYITETGVADAGDELRPLMIQSYMEEVRGGRGWGGEGWEMCRRRVAHGW